MSATWPPEPWHYQPTSFIITGDYEAGQIAKVYGMPDPEAVATARRIVAAINAVAGISTEALEAGVVGEMLEALEFYADPWSEIDPDDRVPDFYDELEFGDTAKVALRSAKGDSP